MRITYTSREREGSGGCVVELQCELSREEVLGLSRLRGGRKRLNSVAIARELQHLLEYAVYMALAIKRS